MKNQVLEQIKKMVESAKGQEMKVFSLEVKAEDSVAVFSTVIVEQNPEQVYNTIDEQYRDKVVGFEPVMYRSYTEQDSARISYFRMVLEEEAQKRFDEEKESYINAKARWCSKFGCD